MAQFWYFDDQYVQKYNIDLDQIKDVYKRQVLRRSQRKYDRNGAGGRQSLYVGGAHLYVVVDCVVGGRKTNQWFFHESYLVSFIAFLIFFLSLIHI